MGTKTVGGLSFIRVRGSELTDIWGWGWGAASSLPLHLTPVQGWAGFQLVGGGGAGVDTALWLDPSPKDSIDAPPPPKSYRD